MSGNLYPLFLNLQGRTCVVVGGTEMAEGKTRELVDAGARIRLIAPEVTNQISAWVQEGKLHWEPKVYEAGDLREAYLVVSVADTDTNARVFADAEAQHIFCNAVDDIQHCSCYASAVVHRGPLQIAISTAGNSPALAQRLRKSSKGSSGKNTDRGSSTLVKRERFYYRTMALPVRSVARCFTSRPVRRRLRIFGHIIR
jgi:precorrin-2 dehydrogenase/sirohydrochlorin ferrochelatase